MLYKHCNQANEQRTESEVDMHVNLTKCTQVFLQGGDRYGMGLTDQRKNVTQRSWRAWSVSDRASYQWRPAREH